MRYIIERTVNPNEGPTGFQVYFQRIGALGPVWTGTRSDAVPVARAVRDKILRRYKDAEASEAA